MNIIEAYCPVHCCRKCSCSTTVRGFYHLEKHLKLIPGTHFGGTFP